MNEQYGGAYIKQYGTKNDADPSHGMYYVKVQVYREDVGITEWYYLCRDGKYRGTALDEAELRRHGSRPTPLHLLQAPRSGYFDNEKQAQLAVRLWNKRNPGGRPRTRNSQVSPQ